MLSRVWKAGIRAKCESLLPTMLERQTYKLADKSLKCETHFGDLYSVHDFIYFLCSVINKSISKDWFNMIIIIMIT